MPEHIGGGRTSDLYSWEGGYVLKLLKANYPAELIQREAHHTRVAYEAGLPAPKVGEASDHGGRFGWLFEHIEGESLAEWLQTTGDGSTAVQTMVSLHAQLHGTQTNALPDLRVRMHQQIKAAPLDDALKQRATLLLDHLPDGDVICHGDFHPENILMSHPSPTIIDWADATRGHALADVARTLVILDGFGHLAPPEMVNMLKEAYLEAYCAYTRASREAIIPWVVPVAAARLSEGDSTLREYLTRVASGHPIV